MHKTSATLFTLAALTGCAHDGAPQPSVDGPTNDGAMGVEANLRALEDLQVFEVGDLIVDMPENAYSCYGPCPGSEDDIAEAEADAAERLAAFTEAATQAQADAVGDPGPQSVDELLAQLEALSIVEIGGLVELQLESAGSCYVGFCPEEIEQRAALAAIVDATNGL